MLGALLKHLVYGSEGASPSKTTTQTFESSGGSLGPGTATPQNSGNVTDDLALTAYFCMR